MLLDHPEEYSSACHTNVTTGAVGVLLRMPQERCSGWRRKNIVKDDGKHSYKRVEI